jgi:flagellar biosynthetic protein FliO
MRLVRPHCFAALGVPMLLLAISLAQPAAALAAFHRDNTPLSPSLTQDASTGHASSGGGAAFARMVVGLVIVIAVIFGIYWLLKTWGARTKGGAAMNNGQIEVLATTALTPNRTVHLLRVGTDVVLVGATDGGVTPLRVYENGDLRELEAGPYEGSFTPAPAVRQRVSFLEALRHRTAR